MNALVARLEGWAARVRDQLSWQSDPSAAAWDAMSVKQYLDRNVRFPAVRRELDLLVRTVTASEPDDLSFFYFLYFLGVCGGMSGVGDGDGGAQTFKLPGGAQQLCVGMARELEAAGALIRLNAPVTSIATTSDCVAVTTARAEVVRASVLVVAVSPPLWSTIAWTPQLSPVKQQVASRMFMGAAVKTIAIYTHKFWQGLAPQGQLEELGPVANLFPSAVGGQPALIGIVTAGAAKRLAALPDHARREQVLTQYASYFGSSAALACTTWMSKDWASEPYSRGCFAALMPPGLATRVGAQARAPEQRVCFAGTELAAAWPGYFEGALDAGYRAAEEVVGLLGGQARARL